MSKRQQVNSLVQQAVERLRQNKQLTAELLQSHIAQAFTSIEQFKPIDLCLTVEPGVWIKGSDLATEAKYLTVAVRNLNGSEQFERTDLVVKAQKKCEKGDLLFCSVGTQQIMGIYQWQFDEAIIRRDIWKLTPKPMLAQRYCYWAIKSLQPVYSERITGVYIPRLTIKAFKELKLPVASQEQQQQIVTQLDLLEDKINQLQATFDNKIERLIELKKAAGFSPFSAKR